MRVGIVGVELDGPAEVLNRRRQITLSLQGERPIVVGFGQVRFQSQGLLVAGCGFVELAVAAMGFEIGAVIYGHSLNTRLADAFTRDLTQCREVKAEALEEQTFFPRLFQSGARLLSPLL